MNALFWICFFIDFLLIILIAAGSKFRTGFGANNNFNNMALLLLILILVAAIVTRILVQPKWVSLILVALPILLMIILYLFEKKTGSSL
jgi:hypothetical protein